MKTDEAIDYFSSKRQLAFALDISPQAISGWGEYPPVLRQYQIQDITNNYQNIHFTFCDNNSESCWLRVWTKFKIVPELYTIWLAEVASTESWGCSTSSYKMRQINV